MRRVVDKSWGITAERILFPSNTIQDSKKSVLRYMRFQDRQNWPQAIEDVAYTYISDLRLNEEQLLSSFAKTVRYEIKRAQTESISTTFFAKQDLLNGDVLLRFEKSYIKFCKETGNKQLLKSYKGTLLKRYMKSEALLITRAEFLGGEIYHVYFYDESHACLWFSVSNFREEGVDRNLAARANKYLHFEDMKHLKNMGVVSYDWGNVSSKENQKPNGIDKFKASFNGTYAEVYSYTVGNTVLGKLLVMLVRRLKGLKEKNE